MKKKAKSLIIPYIAFGIFHYLIWIFYNDFSLEPLLHLIWINTEGLPIAGALWFLTGLFFSEIIYFLINKYIYNDTIKWIIVVIVSLIGTLVNKIGYVTLPYALGAAFVGTGLIHIGYKMKENRNNKIIERLLNMNILTWILLSIMVVNLIFINGYINMRTGKYAIIPLFWINAVFATMLVINLSKVLDNIFKQCKIIYLIKSIGCNSIVYVCLNQVVLLIISGFISKISFFSDTPDTIVKLIELGLALIILSIIAKIIINTRLKIVIGKW